MTEPINPAPVYYEELLKILSGKQGYDDKLLILSELFSNILRSVVQRTGIPFHTTFSIVSYLAHRYLLPGYLVSGLHTLRLSIQGDKRVASLDKEGIFYLAIVSVAGLLEKVYQIPVPGEIKRIQGIDQEISENKQVNKRFIKNERFVAIEKISEEKALLGRVAGNPTKTILVKACANEEFKSSFDFSRF